MKCLITNLIDGIWKSVSEEKKLLMIQAEEVFYFNNTISIGRVRATLVVAIYKTHVL